MSKERDTRKGQGSQPDLNRRQLGVGLLAVLGGGLGVANTAQAFAPGSQGNFNAASGILGRYGVRVIGDWNGDHDRLTFETVPLALTEYSQVVGTRNRLGGIDPCIKTSVFGDDSSFTHFHPGEIIPCVRTTIEGHTLATFELFDAGGIDNPDFKVETEMLDGGVLGEVEVTIDNPNIRLSLRVDGNTYYLVGGELVTRISGVS